MDEKHTDSGFLDLVIRLLTAVIQGKRNRVATLHSFANRKFAELEAEHNLFVQLLRKLTQAANDCAEILSHSDDVRSAREKLVGAIVAVDNVRFDGMDRRTKAFSEAHIYAEQILSEEGIAKKLDATIAEGLRDLMQAYVSYFQTDNMYLHSLGHALTRIRSSTVILKIRSRTFDFEKVDLEHATVELAEVAEAAILSARSRWKIVTEKYSHLNFLILQSGLLDKPL